MLLIFVFFMRTIIVTVTVVSCMLVVSASIVCVKIVSMFLVVLTE